MTRVIEAYKLSGQEFSGVKTLKDHGTDRWNGALAKRSHRIADGIASLVGRLTAIYQQGFQIFFQPSNSVLRSKH